MKKLALFLMVFSIGVVSAQDYWQQKVDYKIQVAMDVQNHQYDGKMDVVYYNNSGDALSEIYFHLYYNAFEPGSLMDERLKHIPDPDGRMTYNAGTKDKPIIKSRIADLKPNEIGFQKINHIQQNGQNLPFSTQGTILKVTLNEPVQPNHSVTLQLDWKSQIPQMIRRGGRDNNENIAYSMTQWYPKVAAYDTEGWHLDEYIAREFYAPFANFDVGITLPSNYIVGASGQLQNEDQMPGYSNTKVKRNIKTLTWNFKAENIHDFAWAADESYIVEKQAVENGPTLYYLYSKDLEKTYQDNWKQAQPLVAQFFQITNERFGKYPWDTYTILQGGDGGMEYGAATLVTGTRSLESLAGVIFHEAAHSWFQQMYGIDETRHEWMDEGFTSYAEAYAAHKILGAKKDQINPYEDAYKGYYVLATSGNEEPMSILADYYNMNRAYSLAAYYKGQVYIAQLGYIIGEDALSGTLLAFYDKWHLKHPKPSDFQKVAQDVSGINLKWYNNLFINTTRVIDYAIEKVEEKEITLHNKSNFAMPLDVLVTYQDGSKELFYIPINAMRGEKQKEEKFYPNIPMTTLKAWGWTSPSYKFQTKKEVKSVQIDYTKRLADVDQSNNVYPKTSK
ncbi:M1 family peptidase [Flavobacteriaceae bacterium Ap0902]|nr:M1 family peptidase [Flavobacteriaceae bacterium Ap0902]